MHEDPLVVALFLLGYGLLMGCIGWWLHGWLHI